MSAEAKVVTRALRVQPRVIFLSDAPRYLGMSAEQFNVDVRPQLTEAKLGTRVVFDREELDEWWHEFIYRNGKRGKKPSEQERARWQGRKGALAVQDFGKRQAASGTSTKGSGATVEYAKARAHAISKTRKNS